MTGEKLPSYAFACPLQERALLSDKRGLQVSASFISVLQPQLEDQIRDESKLIKLGTHMDSFL